MRAIVLCAAALVNATASGAEPDAEVKKLLTRNSYSVTWGKPTALDASSVLEIGNGALRGAHEWLRFVPGKDGVTVYSVRLAGAFESEAEKAPPGRAPVKITRGVLKTEVYANLLKQLAAVEAATLKPNELIGRTASFSAFWVSARLTTEKKERFNWDWAGYDANNHEIDSAKPNATVWLAREALTDLKMRAHELTAEDRAGFAARFVREWPAHKDLESHWWVRTNNIVLIGETGDASVYPALREALNRKVDDHCVPAAIYAVTRLTGKKLSTKPGEEDDVAKVRDEALKLIPKK